MLQENSIFSARRRKIGHLNSIEEDDSLEAIRIASTSRSSAAEQEQIQIKLRRAANERSKKEAMILFTRSKVDLRRNGAASIAEAVHRNVVTRTTATSTSSPRRARGQQQRSSTRTLPRVGPLVALLGGCLLALAFVALAVLVSADQQQQQQQQEAAFADLAAASSNNYDQQQQQQQQQGAGSKAKKIQIVYIKVPLAKLRPSLSGQASGDYRGATGAAQLGSSGSNYSTGAKVEQQQYETTDLKSATGSQASSSSSSSDEQQQQQQQHMSSSDIANIDLQQQHEQSNGRQQPQSFLIPMALVQTAPDEPSAEPQPPHQQQQQLESDWPAQMSQAGSQLHAAHTGPLAHEHRSPMQMYRQLVTQPAGLSAGFMSGFLLGEKEKMTAAAMRLQSQLASQSAAAAVAVPAPTIAASTASQQQAHTMVSPTNGQQQPSLNLQLLQNPKGPGGLMPPMMMPYSRMPDNAIGQAYGAAVGTALPAESGSPSSLLSSSSSSNSFISSNNSGYKGKQLVNSTGSNQYANSNSGVSSGTSGLEGYSSGTGSSTSFGSAQSGPTGAGFGANNYQNSIRDSGASGASSGFGSGTSISGASGAFSDYPRAPFSSNSHPHNQYGGQQQATLVNVASSGSPEQPQQPHDGYSAARLKQAKKTIIPIVVQVEHAILENAQAAQNTAANYLSGANGAATQQPHQHNHSKGSNKYGAKGHRQTGGKRGARFGANKEHHNKGSASTSNQLYGAATNDVAHFGDVPPGAQFVNAANMHDINQITAQINAENAASAAAALAQADASFGPGMPPVYGQAASSISGSQHAPARRPQHGHSQQGAGSQYLQSAASALLANTHPMIQAAASGGFASVSKLGAKLGEIMALPSMQMPSSIAQIGSSLPSALSSLTNTMGSQLAQSVQQVAKEHPMASSFARQIAQQAGIQLPAQFFTQQQSASGSSVGQMHQAQQSVTSNNAGGHGLGHSHGQQVATAASNLQQQLAVASPQALQNLKLSIGQNLHALMGANQKAASFAQQAGLLNGVGGPAGQVAAFGAALKQLSSVSPVAAQLASQLAGVSQSMSAAASSTQQQAVAAPPQMAATSNTAPQQQQQQPNAASHLMEQLISAAAANAPIQIPANIQQQVLGHFLQQQQAAGAQQSADSAASLEAAKPAKAGFKSKFLSFFQPPKFISNLLSWNDRADDRHDEGIVESIVAANATSTTTTSDLKSTSEANKTTSLAPTTTVAESTSSAIQAKSTTVAVTTAGGQTSTVKPPTTISQSSTTTTAIKEVPKTTTVAAQQNSTSTTTTVLSANKQESTKAKA